MERSRFTLALLAAGALLGESRGALSPSLHGPMLAVDHRKALKTTAADDERSEQACRRGARLMYGWSGSRRETRAERSDRVSLHVNATLARVAALPDEKKTALLANAIVDALLDRGMVAQADLCRSGLSDFEIERLYPDAIAVARALEPSLFAASLE